MLLQIFKRDLGLKANAIDWLASHNRKLGATLPVECGLADGSVELSISLINASKKKVLAATSCRFHSRKVYIVRCAFER